MNLRVLVVPALLLCTSSACATLQRAKAAEAMQCPESELEQLDIKQDDAEGAKLLLALIAAPIYSPPLSYGVARKAAHNRFRGCGRTFDCDPDGCDETPHSRAARLSKVVPELMEKSRQRLGADAVAEQVGFFTWELSSSRGSAQCRLAAEKYYACTPDLDVLQ